MNQMIYKSVIATIASIPLANDELISCRDGSYEYQTTSKVSMDLHVELMHPISSTTIQPVTMSKEELLLHCALCPFKSQSKAA